MSKIDRLQKLIDKGYTVISTHKPNSPGVIGFPTLDSGAFTAWKTQSLNFLKTVLSTDSPYIQTFESQISQGYKSTVESGIGILQSVKEDLESGYLEDKPKAPCSIEILKNMFSNFHVLARQLRARHENRSTLDVKDEYDVQDLLNALLFLHFDDVRPEEWTPSYAGKSSRMDFLLKKEQIVIEVKKTRKSLTAKELGSQLIEDIERYKSHPDCKTLICFVYDPEGLIANPRGIENDLNRIDSHLVVEVVIRP